jgi:tetratricopeptide (TPR) repeat protein
VKLGAVGAELTALSGFFDRLWDKPEPSLREGTQAWLLNEAGFDLRALGRLAEAGQLMSACLDALMVHENWMQAARAAGNLSELSLTLGTVGEAERYARQCVDLADRSGDAFERMGKRTTLADALHQAGRLEEAETAFREAEAMQKARQPEYPLLYAFQGHRYCDLLLTRAGFGLELMPVQDRVKEAESGSAIETCRHVQGRATQTLKWYESARKAWLLDIALDHLSLGRALLLEHVLNPDACSLDPAVEHLDAAVDGLRESGNQDDVPRGLLARAALRRVSGDAAGAARDLGDAQELADRCGMKLFQVDCLIEQACQLIADREDKARECVAQAKALIESTGYHRRDPEIQYLEQLLA